MYIKIMKKQPIFFFSAASLIKEESIVVWNNKIKAVWVYMVLLPTSLPIYIVFITVYTEKNISHANNDGAQKVK